MSYTDFQSTTSLSSYFLTPLPDFGMIRCRSGQSDDKDATPLLFQCAFSSPRITTCVSSLLLATQASFSVNCLFIFYRFLLWRLSFSYRAVRILLYFEYSLFTGSCSLKKILQACLDMQAILISDHPAL